MTFTQPSFPSNNLPSSCVALPNNLLKLETQFHIEVNCCEIVLTFICKDGSLGVVSEQPSLLQTSDLTVMVQCIYVLLHLAILG